VRVVAATGLAFVGLGLVVCLILPRAYQQQAKAHLRERTEILARSVTLALQREYGRSGEVSLSIVSEWLGPEPDFEAAVVLDSQGNVLDGWPAPTDGWGRQIPERLMVTESTGHFVAISRLVGTEESAAAVGIRTSTDRLHSDLMGVLWLFASILLLTCAGFVVLATYLTRGILHPLEEIRKAAMDLADGEPLVNVPMSGDLEIDELGGFIAALGAKRRHSTVMQNPLARKSAPANRPQTPNPPRPR
jgi:hypothetical protein